MWQIKMASEEKIKKKIIKIYENYGMDTAEMDDEEFERLVDFYKTNPNILKKDYQISTEQESATKEE